MASNYENLTALQNAIAAHRQKKQMQENNTTTAVTNCIGRALTKVLGGCLYDANNFLWRHVGEEWVGKEAVQVKANPGWRAVWVEEAREQGLVLDPAVQKWSHLVNT